MHNRIVQVFRRVHARTCRNTCDRGSMVLETLIIYPAVLLLTFAMVQATVFFHARNVARNVANAAVMTARVDGATAEDGVAVGTAQLERAGGASLIRGGAVAVDRGPATVTATVTGSVIAVIPLVPGWSLTQTATGPVERFVSEAP